MILQGVRDVLMLRIYYLSCRKCLEVKIQQLCSSAIYNVNRKDVHASMISFNGKDMN